MTGPALSVVVPTLNEEQWIEEFLGRVSRYLESRGLSWEIVVADDGSSDATAARVEQWAAADPRVRLLRQPHRGKGAAVRGGLLAATGTWRLMTDADLSVSPDDWSVLLDAAAEPSPADVIVGSREVAGARRIGEPVTRHVIGRAFNWIVRLLAVPGINDTQCGFKLLRGEAAQALVPRLTLNGFAFDVELLFLAQRAGFTIREVGVVWTCRPDSRVRLASGAAAFADVIRIRWRARGGRSRHAARRSAAGPQSRGRPSDRDHRAVKYAALLGMATFTALTGARLTAPPLAPRVHVRWGVELSQEERLQYERRFRLVAPQHLEGMTWAYDLSDPSTANVAALVRHAAVEDTHWIDRQAGAVAADAPRGATPIGAFPFGPWVVSEPVGWAATLSLWVALLSGIWLAVTGRSATPERSPRTPASTGSPHRNALESTSSPAQDGLAR